MDDFIVELTALLDKHEVYSLGGGYGGEVEINSENFYIELNLCYDHGDKQSTLRIHKKEGQNE